MITIYVYVKDDKVTGWGTSPDVGTIEVTIPEDHGFFTTPMEYNFINGEFVLDEDRLNELRDKANRPSEIEVLRAEVERLQEKQFESDMALMDIVETMFGEM